MAPRPIRIEGKTGYVPLTRDYFSVVDAGVVPLISSWSWRAHNTRGKIYASRGSYETGKFRELKLHRFLLGEPALEVDHINGDSLDNRLCNLRLVTRAQNCKNRLISKNNKSGYKGVHFEPKRGKWIAQIKHELKHYSLGEYSSPEEAYAAYCEASERLHGKYGNLG
jgi:hypothetical protein